MTLEATSSFDLPDAFSAKYGGRKAPGASFMPSVLLGASKLSFPQALQCWSYESNRCTTVAVIERKAEHVK